MNTTDRDDQPEILELGRPVVNYARTEPDAHPELRTAPLVWLSRPACVGALLFSAMTYQIRAHPGDETAGSNFFVALVVVLILSGITSGAAVLAVLDSRKTILNVFFLTLNLVWLIACIGLFVLRRIVS